MGKRQDTEARTMKRDYRVMSLNMASTQCNRFENGDPGTHTRDVVRMASTYYDWLWAAKVPVAVRYGHAKAPLRAVK